MFLGRLKILLLFPGHRDKAPCAVPSARAGTIKPSKRYRRMSIEKRALLDHAERCRRVAGDLAHSEAARRLQSMAEEYEQRAARLDDDGVHLKQSYPRRRYTGDGSDREG